jgi:serine/threonine protein kinase
MCEDDNLVLDGMQLTDFGLSRWLDPGVRSHVSTQTFGTIPYMPAELLVTGRLTKAVDVYSFGIIMNELYSMKVGKLFLASWLGERSHCSAHVSAHQGSPICTVNLVRITCVDQSVITNMH